MRTLLRATLSVFVLVMPSIAIAQDRVFKSRVDMVALTVSVTDANGQSVAGLSADDFVIFEDGVRQELILFGSDGVPVDVALVVDTSSSMTTALPMVKLAASGLVKTLRNGDRAAVVDVKDSTRVPQPLTRDLMQVEAAIGRLTPRGSTALHDAIYITLRQFARERIALPEEARRHAVIVLSDGVDTASHVAFEAITELARNLDVTIYTIALRDQLSSDPGIREALRGATWEMGSLARETGGRAFFPASALALQGIYDTIGRELANQYALGYVSSAAGAGAFRRIGLKLLPPAEGTPRTRAGYVGKTRERLKER